MSADPFNGLPRQHFGVVLADPPWRFRTWNKATAVKRRASALQDEAVHYNTMTIEDIAALPVADLAADNCCLFLWISWPLLSDALHTIDRWGFNYKTCAFSWVKTNGFMGMGYWTRANSEVCLLATRGKPKRLNADVRQAILEPRREHSRKPDIHERIERLVAGPYLELFARECRPGWHAWGDQVDLFNPLDGYDAMDDMTKSINACYEAVKKRMSAGGPGFDPDRDPPA